MSNIKKSLLSFAIIIFMMFTMLPITSTYAESTEVNLIKDENGALREGVYISFYGGEYNTSTSDNNQENAYDGNVNTYWTSAWSPENSAYVQVNFPVSQQLTKIRLRMNADDYFRDNFKVLVSNDISFTEFVEVYSQGSTPLGLGTWLEIDMTDYNQTFKYVKVIRSSSLYKFLNISELEVYGFRQALPDVSGDSILTENCDVTAESSKPYSKSFLAQNVLDGDESTGTFALGGKDAYVQIDLKRKAQISKVGFLNYQDDYISTRINFDIVASNDPNFASATVLYSRNGDEVGKGEWVYAYGVDNVPYRYIRIRKNASAETKNDYEMSNFHQFLCIAEVKIWGTESENVVIEELAKEATVSATSEESSATNSVDGDFTNTVWNNSAESGKAAITYTFDEPKVFTSVEIFPEFDNEEACRNFAIWASESGSFDDGILIAEVSDDGIKKGCFTAFSVEDLRAYKAVKIESTIPATPQNAMGIAEVMICYDNTAAAVEVTKTSPYDGETGVTNINGKNNFIEIELNRNIDRNSLIHGNVIITNKNDNSVVDNWSLYKVDGKKAKIDISALSSKTDYEVAVTKGVTASGIPISSEFIFSFTTGVIAKIPYTEGKMIKNVALNKKVSGAVYSGSGPASNMVDGNDATTAYGNPSYQFDLGNYYDVVAIELVPQSSNPDNNWLLQGLNVLGDKTDMDISNITAEEANALKLATYSSNSTKRETFVLETPQKMRYIGLWRTGTYIVLCELNVYALVDTDFGQWQVTKDGTKTDEINGAGIYEFSIPVINYGTDNSYYMTISAIGENGIPFSTYYGDVSAENNKVTKSITIDETVTDIYAVITDSRKNGKLMCDVKTISKESKPIAEGLKETISFKSTDGGFTLSVTSKENSDFTETDRFLMTVLKPGTTFDNNLSDDGFDGALCTVQGINSLKNGERADFNFGIDENMLYGKYNIRATITDENGNVSHKYFTYNNIDPDEISECVNTFKNFKEADDDMAALLSEYVTEKEFISQAAISVTPESLSVNFEKYFEYFKDLYCTDSEFSKITDVVNCLNGAYVISKFDEGKAQEASLALNKYPDVLKEYFDTNCNTEKFIKVFGDLKSNIKDAETLKEILNWASVLSYIQDGTGKDVRDAIEKNAELLGCDIGYAQSKEISLNQVVMYIDTKEASKYYKESLGIRFKQIVDELAGGNPPATGVVTSKPVTNESNFSAAIPSDSINKPVEPQKQEDTNVQKIPFDDIENVVWAKDYIIKLYKNGIISGDENGNFNPEKQVTREEFIKMIVEALELNAVAGVSASFDDCNEHSWYYPYVQIAASNKIIKGIDRNNFGVGQFIKRQDMAVILEKALAIKNISPSEKELEFTDSETISEYAQASVSKMNNIGLINGFDGGTFGPNESTTRAQAAVIIGRMIDYLKEVSK